MNTLFLFAAACTGLGLGSAARSMALTPPSHIANDRRDALRKKSAAFRMCEPLVHWLAGVYRRNAPAALSRLAGSLETLNETEWKPEEYAAAKHLEMLPAAAILGMLAAVLTTPTAGLAMAAFAMLLAPAMVFRNARRNAARRVKRIRGRLPYTLDLMALVLEAGGGTLHHCLKLAADENDAHPLGDEMSRVVTAIDQGSSPESALHEMGRRLDDSDIGEFVLAVTTAEARGLPLKEALRAISERLRGRQVQWMEKASEEAKVHITWPAMVVMAGCLLIVVAPMVISAVRASN